MEGGGKKGKLKHVDEKDRKGETQGQYYQKRERINHYRGPVDQEEQCLAKTE